MSDLYNHSLEFLKWDAGYPRFTRANPSIEDCEEVGSLCLFQPNSFIDSVKIEAGGGFLCRIFPIELVEFLFGDGIIIVDLIRWEDIVYSRHRACANMT